MRSRIITLITMIACTLWSAASAAEKALPNILMISVDTMRGDALGLYEGKVDTPWMDRLAQDGVYFREARAQAPWTLPNFASIFTGLRPYRHGALSKQLTLSPDFVTMAELLRDLGYRTESHVNADVLGEAFSMDQGFDRLTYHPPGWDDRFHPEGAARSVKRCNEVFQGDGPWFMHVHFFDAHTPYITPPPYNTLYYDGNPTIGDAPIIPFLQEADERCVRENKYEHFGGRLPLSPWLDNVKDLQLPLAQYRGGVAWVDTRVGLILSRLKYLGLYDDALIILLSDHGDTMGEQGYYFSHILPYDGVLHVPLAIKFPGGTFQGTVIDNWVQTMDLLPTLADYMDFDLPVSPDGESLMPLIEGKGGYGRELFTAEMGENNSNFIKSISDGRWHAIRFEHNGQVSWELYDLLSDPGEAVDLGLKESKRLKSMEKKLWKIFDRAMPLSIAPTAAASQLTDEQRERLRALGY